MLCVQPSATTTDESAIGEDKILASAHGLARSSALLVIAGDAGGARALVPVVRVLRGLRNVSVELRAYGAALDVWRLSGLDSRPVRSDSPAGFDHVLSGTSFLQERWELRVARRAREYGIPTLAVVDFWSQYRE